MNIRKEIIINQSIDAAWKVLGPGFAHVATWASPVTHSDGNGGHFHGSECSERGCSIEGFGRTREKLVQYSDADHLLTYTVPEGLPTMVAAASNAWQLHELNQHQTKLVMEMNFKLKGLMGWIMAPVLKMLMNRMANTITNDYKFFVEHGKVSAAKEKALRKK